MPAERPEGARGERDYIRLGGPCLHQGGWEFTGGKNACCIDPDCCCSVPVHVCRWCGDCDYGDNDEADQVRTACAEMGPA